MPGRVYAGFAGRLVIVGFGSIGQGVMPLLLRHLDIRPDQIAIVTAEPRGREIAAEYGIEFIEHALARENHREVLTPRLGQGDFLLNVSVDVSSLALIEFCQERGALYLDTCIEPWPGGYTDPNLPPSPCAAKTRPVRPPSLPTAPTPASSRISSSRRWSIWRSPRPRPTARAGL